MTEPREDHRAYVTPGARRRFRRMGIALAFFVIVLAVTALLAINANSTARDAKSTADKEVAARVVANGRAIRVGCDNVNDLARALKALIASQGTVITPADAAQFGFEDPAVTRYVQGIIARSQANADRLHSQGDGIKLLDCAKVATTPGG